MSLDLTEFVEDLITDEGTSQSIVDKVKYECEKRGLGEFSKPKGGSPKLPQRVSTLSDEEMADMHAVFIVWMGYVGEQIAIYDIIHKELTSTLDFTIRKIRLKSVGTVAEREDKSRTHPKVMKLEGKALEARAMLVMLKNKYNTFKEGKSLCSRDVERRREDRTSSIRDDSIRSIRTSVSRKTKKPRNSSLSSLRDIEDEYDED